jgi:hypothetical protein
MRCICSHVWLLLGSEVHCDPVADPSSGNGHFVNSSCNVNVMSGFLLSNGLVCAGRPEMLVLEPQNGKKNSQQPGTKMQHTTGEMIYHAVLLTRAVYTSPLDCKKTKMIYQSHK